MPYLNQTYELLTGGYYAGNPSWNNTHSDIDNCFKLYQLTAGEVVVSDNEQTFKLQKNDLYFINGNKLSSQHCNQPFSTFWLHFIPKDLIIYQGLLSMPTVVKLSSLPNQLSELMPMLHKLLTSTISSSWEYAVKTLSIQTFLQSTTLELFDQHPIDQQALTIKAQRIEPAIHYMKEHYHETVKLEQLADLCCMSPNYFHKIFRNILNMTPVNYLTLLRMNAALQLLDENMAIKNIAYELGFTDDAYFCRSFKKYYGISPGEYQKKRGTNLR